MIKIIASCLMLLCLKVSAQTFVNFHVPNDGTNFLVPSNILAKIIETEGVGSGFSVTYPFSTNIFFGTFNLGNGSGPDGLKPYVLGPATIGFSDSQYEGVYLIELDPVNVSPVINGIAVQPSNTGATINLETSTNLSTWEATTNGTYPATPGARFFRMNLSVSK